MTIPPLSSSEDESARSQPGYGGERAASVGSEPSAASVHRVCDLIKEGGCKLCPRRYEIDGEMYGSGCYLHAREIVNTVETGNPWRKTAAVRAPFVPAQAPSDPSTAWRGIASAPRDGTLILLLSAPYTTAADEWSPEIRHGAAVALGKWSPEGTSWVDKYGSLDGDAERLQVTGTWLSEGGWFQPNEVTHWMPLPGAPS